LREANVRVDPCKARVFGVVKLQHAARADHQRTAKNQVGVVKTMAALFRTIPALA
jgi:hypothetical protein